MEEMDVKMEYWIGDALILRSLDLTELENHLSFTTHVRVISDTWPLKI